MIYWLTGQPGAGKTTMAKYLVYNHVKSNMFHIDGDVLRNIFDNRDYSEQGRRRNIERAQDIAQFLDTLGYNVVVSLVSPYKDQRELFKSKCNVTEIYVHTTDIRGRENFHVEEYEPPTENYIDLDTTGESETSTFYKLLSKISL